MALPLPSTVVSSLVATQNVDGSEPLSWHVQEQTGAGGGRTNQRRPAWENTVRLEANDICDQCGDNWQLAATRFQVLTRRRSLDAVIAVTELVPLSNLPGKSLAQHAPGTVGAVRGAHCTVHVRLVYVRQTGRWRTQAPSCAGSTAT